MAGSGTAAKAAAPAAGQATDKNTADTGTAGTGVLWLVATWFEDDARWLPAMPEATPELAAQPIRGDTPVRTNTDTLSWMLIISC